MKQHLFRVRPNKLNVWLEWVTELNNRKDEVVITLREENSTREFATLFTIDGQSYIYMAMDFAGEPVVTNLERELNQTHRAKLSECLEFVDKGELLYDFKIE